MEIVYLIAGFLLVGTATVDLISTTLWLDGGAGLLSRPLTALSWQVIKKVSGRNKRVLGLAGPIIILIILLTWVVLLWSGWVLIFSADAQSLIDTNDSDPIAWYERVYVIGYSLFTLGNGDYAPKEGIWQFAAALISGTGMLFLTLGASYVISVVGAVAQLRACASSITGIGMPSVEIVKKGWDGKDFQRLDLMLLEVSSQLSTLVQQHKAYPLLHYYHSEHPDESLSAAIVTLDEALTIIKYGFPASLHPNPLLLEQMRASIGNYLEAEHAAFVRSEGEVPPPPDLESLREAGLPVVSDAKFKESLTAVTERRRDLQAVIEADMQEWPS